MMNNNNTNRSFPSSRRSGVVGVLRCLPARAKRISSHIAASIVSPAVEICGARWPWVMMTLTDHCLFGRNRPADKYRYRCLIQTPMTVNISYLSMWHHIKLPGGVGVYTSSVSQKCVLDRRCAWYKDGLGRRYAWKVVSSWVSFLNPGRWLRLDESGAAWSKLFFVGW